MENLTDFLILKKASLKDAMKLMDANPIKMLFVVEDSKNKLVGSLTDGDVRRWIISNGGVEAEVINVCNNKPIYALENSNVDDLKSQLTELKINAIPIISMDGMVINMVINEELCKDGVIVRGKHRKLDIPVVIMAGGFGTRLDPFTRILPKPLIPIGNKTIIEIIIDKFLDYDIKKFYVSVNHKSNIIKSYFDELNPEYEINLVKEEKPLGTIGSLSLMKGNFTSPILITNCDIIIDIDYADLMDFHTHNGYDISLVASMMNYKIPYGICEIENGGKLIDFKEKPEISYLASTGMYIINPELLELIPENEFFHVTHLMEKVRSNGGKVGVYPIRENSWFDTGEWSEYKKTIEKFNA